MTTQPPVDGLHVRLHSGANHAFPTADRMVLGPATLSLFRDSVLLGSFPRTTVWSCSGALETQVVEVMQADPDSGTKVGC